MTAKWPKCPSGHEITFHDAGPGLSVPVCDICDIQASAWNAVSRDVYHWTSNEDYAEKVRQINQLLEKSDDLCL